LNSGDHSTNYLSCLNIPCHMNCPSADGGVVIKQKRLGILELLIKKGC